MGLRGQLRLSGALGVRDVLDCTAFSSPLQETQTSGMSRQIQEKRMPQNSDSNPEDLHTKAAYAHAAAAHGHSTGDYASAQELARRALEYSLEALKQTEEISKDTPQSMQV